MSPPMIREDSRNFPSAHTRSATVKRPLSQFVTTSLRAEAVEIDRDVDIFAGETHRKFFKTLAPIITQDRALPLSIF